MDSKFSIQPCTRDDLDLMVETWRTSFAKDPFMLSRYPESRVARPVLDAWVKGKFAAYINTSHGQTWKAIEIATGSFAGYAHFKFPHTLNEEEKEKERIKKEKDDERERTGEAFPEGSNFDICRSKLAGWARLKKELFSTENMYFLDFIGVFPSYQGCGVGKMLISQGLALADAANQQTYLFATIAGRPVYEKMGFRVVDVMEVDMGEYGIGRNWAMLRDPKAN